MVKLETNRLIIRDYVKEGERLKAQYHDGEMKDRFEYAINKDEFLKAGETKC